jgi:CPA2 family monovalent cation:H+ antiporter-2
MPLAVLATFLIIVVGKSLAAFLIVLAFGHPRHTALTISASLAQIGEFSFILAGLGVDLDLLSREAQDLVLAGAILSIVANPLVFALLDPWLSAPTPSADRSAPSAPPEADGRGLAQSALTGHAVVAGYGFVGRFLVEELRALGRPFLVIDDREENTEKLRAEGIEAITGNAASDAVLAAANVAEADWLLVALPNVFEAGQVIAKARRANPDIKIYARAETEREVEHLRSHGADEVIVGRREIAVGMIELAFGRPATAVAASAG